MKRRRSPSEARPEFSLSLIFVYALFALLSPCGQDALPKGARLQYQAFVPESDAGAAVKSIGMGGIWIDDEQDACHSSPVDRKQDDPAPFALIDSENLLRKGAAAAPVDLHFTHAARIAFRPIPTGTLAASSYLGPDLPFADRFPPFLISDLPPPRPA